MSIAAVTRRGGLVTAHLRAGLGAVVAGVTAVLVAACGGGGGSSQASFTVDSPTSVTSSVYEGEMIPPVVMHLRVTEHPEALAGKTLYLVAALPDAALFEPTPFVSLDSDGLGGVIELLGKFAPTGSHTYSDKITVQACLDPACSTPLSVSNNQIPYTINVKPGLTLSMAEATLTANFGVVPAAVDIAVGLPNDLVSWTVQATHGATLSVFDVQKLEDVAGTQLRVTAQTLGYANTTQDEYATITAVTASGVTLKQGLHMVQHTGPSAGRAWAFQRPTVTFNVPLGSINGTDPVMAGVMFPGNNSDRWTYLGTTDWQWPAAASSHPQRNNWLMANQSPSGSPPSNYFMNDLSADPWGGGATSLPAGQYQVTMRYRYAPVGRPVELVNHIVTLNVGP